MNFIPPNYLKICEGNAALLAERKYSESAPKKYLAMQKKYVADRPAQFPPETADNLNYFVNTWIHKFYMVNLTIEQLHACHWCDQTKGVTAYDAFMNSIGFSGEFDDSILIETHYFENFLFYASSFIKMTKTYKRRFFETINGNHPDIQKKMGEKKKRLDKYFMIHIHGKYKGSSLSDNNWGHCVRYLRNHVTHRDKIEFPGYFEQVSNDLQNYPQIRDSVRMFCQYIENGMFDVIQTMYEILFDVEWTPGSYEEGMFDD